MLLATVAVVLGLIATVKSDAVRVTGHVLCPGESPPTTAEVQLWDLDQPDGTDDHGG